MRNWKRHLEAQEKLAQAMYSNDSQPMTTREDHHQETQQDAKADRYPKQCHLRGMQGDWQQGSKEVLLAGGATFEGLALALNQQKA